MRRRQITQIKKSSRKKRKNKSPRKTWRLAGIFTLFLFIAGFGVAFGQDSVEWIGSYSLKESESYREDLDKEKTIYYYWQLESLKRAVSPRYVRVIDIEGYSKTGKILTTGILFTYYGLQNEEASVCGNFSEWQCIPMRKNPYGVFLTIIPVELKDKNENIKMTYEYKFKIDDLYDFDPTNPNKIEDGEGSYLSEYILEKPDQEKQVAAKIIDREILDDLDFKVVEFRIRAPEANTVALVGDFNHWNPEHDYLQKEEDGIFRLRKKLKPGEYLYNYVIDGRINLDTFNSETRHRVETDELSSYIKVENNRM